MQMQELRERATLADLPPRPRPAPLSPQYREWLRAGLWVVPLVLGLSVGTAYVLTSLQTPVYRSSATLAVVPGATVDSTTEILRALETLERRTVIATFAQLASSLTARAARAEGLAPDSLEMFAVRAYVVPNTNLVRIQADGPDRGRVAGLANAVARETATEAQAMYRAFMMTTVGAAAPPSRPIAPTMKRSLAVAAVLGAFLGLAATYLLVRWRDVRGALA